jgi:hypothetical protein
LKKIIYGLVSEPFDEEKHTIAGCEITLDAPSRKCSDCGWEGGLGGRAWQTIWQAKDYYSDENSPTGESFSVYEFDLKALDTEQLIARGATQIEARFELAHRGMSPEEVDDLFEDTLSMPLVEKWGGFLFYNTKTHLIERAAIFSAHWTNHTFQFLSFEGDEWEIVSNMLEFHEAVFSMKRDDIQVWSIDIPEDMSDEDFMSDPTNYGSNALKKLIAGETITDDELFNEGGFFQTPIFWPHWFDPGLMLTQQRSFFGD